VPSVDSQGCQDAAWFKPAYRQQHTAQSKRKARMRTLCEKKRMLFLPLLYAKVRGRNYRW
jgi:hypothetical protein